MWAEEKSIGLLQRKLEASGTDRELWWRPGNGEHEVSFALHLVTLQLELYHGARNSAEKWKAKFAKRDWLTGTIDWLRWGAADVVAWVDDLKTGHWPVDPGTSKQLLSYSLVPWIKAGRPSSWDSACSITTWEKYPLWGTPSRKSAWKTALDLEEHLDDLRWTRDHPDEVNPEPIYIGPWDPDIPLSHCTFCDCRPDFPVAAWMGNYRYTAGPHCLPGIIKRLNDS